jgi:hypothetical protein
MAINIRRPRAVLNLVTGKTVVGDLLWSWPWSYRLRNTQIVEPGSEPSPADGTVVVPARAVEFVQIVG